MQPESLPLRSFVGQLLYTELGQEKIGLGFTNVVCNVGGHCTSLVLFLSLSTMPYAQLILLSFENAKLVLIQNVCL